MKRLLFALVLMILMSPLLFAETINVQIGDLWYNLDTSKKTADVTCQDGFKGTWLGSTTGENYSMITVNIPAQVSYQNEDYAVTTLDSYAFQNAYNLESITIPNSITKIGSAAFKDANNLKDVNIPDGVISIPSGCFNGCSSLMSIILPENLTSIGYDAFGRCSALISINIPLGVTEIASAGFSYCSSLPSITLPEKLTTIGSSAFQGCTALTSVTIPSGVTDIPGTCFLNCSSLMSITLPENLTSIGYDAFGRCSALTSINIPSGVTEIPLMCFYNCSSLPSITLPENLTTIGSSAFDGCSALTSINIPSRVTEIPSDCFYNCSSLPSITLPENLTTIGSSAFRGCSALNSINIPSGVAEIPSSCFENCSSLPSITLPENLTSIGSRVFCGCSALNSINIPPGVTEIPSFCFYNCSSLPSITLPENLTIIGSSAFDGCSALTSVSIPSGVTVIPSSCFYNCSSLPSIILPENLTTIGSSAFRGCSVLTSVNIPSGVTEIPSSCFYDCSSLPSITLPENLTTIGSSAFRGCSALNLVNIPSGVTEIPSYCFYVCSSLPSIALPENLTIIGERAFRGCSTLTSVNIPSGVAEIPLYCFYNCSSLPSITLPENLTSIGTYAFQGCNKLLEVNSLAVEPPTVEASNAFGSTTKQQGILSVPVKSVEDYSSAPVWEEFQNIVAIPTDIEGSLTIEDFAISANETLEIPVNLEANLDGSNNYAGLQFDVTLPESLTLTDVQLGTELQEAGYTLQYKDRGDNLTRIIVTPTTNLDGVDFTENLVILTVTAAKKLTPGSAQVQITNAFLSTVKGGDVFLDDSSTQVTYNSSIETISITPQTQNVVLGGTGTLTATVNPSDALNQQLVWSVSDPDVASITGEGTEVTVNGLKLGSVIVKATSPFDETIFAEATVNVVGTLAITGDRSEIKVTETLQLSAALTEPGAVTPELTWSSSAPEVASVNNDGLVTGLAEGNAVITATAKDYEGITATYEVVVNPILLGDANDNGIVSVADVVTIANHIVDHPVIGWSFVNADVTGDKTIGTGDITGTVNIILDETDYDSRRSLKAMAPLTTDRLVSDNFESSAGMQNIGVGLDNSIEYSALQADVKVPDGMEITEVVTGPRAAAHTLMYNIKSDGTVKLVLFSFSNMPFLPGDEPLFVLVGNTREECGDLTITNIIGSDRNNNEYELGFDGGMNSSFTTSVGNLDGGDIKVNIVSDGVEILHADGAAVNVFNVNGSVVASIPTASDYEKINLAKGIYIITAGNRTVKAIVK